MKKKNQAILVGLFLTLILLGIIAIPVFNPNSMVPVGIYYFFAGLILALALIGLATQDRKR